jgi:hypothetical protein
MRSSIVHFTVVPQLFTRTGIGKLLGPIFERDLKRNYIISPHNRTHKGRLIMIADFGGQHRTQFETYAFLIFDLNENHEWFARQRGFRRTLIRKRRISFKAMNDSHRRRALVPFLDIGNSLIGHLFIFAVPKNGESLFDSSDDESASDRKLLETWKPTVREKLLRILHISSFLLSGLSTPTQDVTWIIDEDDVASNSNQLTALTNLFGTISSHYLLHSLGHLRCGTTASDDGTLAIEDLAAIPDLVAGAVCEIGNAMGAGWHTPSKMIAPLPSRLSWKSRVLATWLGNDRSTLRRFTYIIRVDAEAPGIGVTALKWHAVPGGLALPYKPLPPF